MSEPIELTTKTVLSLVGIGVFGALVHAINAFKKRERPTLMDFIINSVTATFSGTMFGLLAYYSFNDIVVVLMLTGIGSYLGIEGLAVVVTVLQNAIKTTIIK